MNIDLTNAGSVSIGEPHKFNKPHLPHQAQEIMLILVIADDQMIKI